MHADVLKLAKSKGQRERIKWFHARFVIFDCEHFGDGLVLARDSEHEDARFLVALFGDRVPKTKTEAAAVFLAQKDDARCMSWAALCGAFPSEALFLASAERGDALGQFCVGRMCAGPERVKWLEAAVAQGEPKAMSFLAMMLFNGWGGFEDKKSAKRLWKQAALLGEMHAQRDYADKCCVADSVGQLVWLRRSAMQGPKAAFFHLRDAAWKHVPIYRKQGHSGRIIFEIGCALSNIDNWEGHGCTCEVVRDCWEAIGLYNKWCDEAKRAVMCWIWLARNQGVAKDIRLLIADLIWTERPVWSERPGRRR